MIATLVVDPSTPSTLYAGTEAGVFDIEQVSSGPTEAPTATPTPGPCAGDCGGDEQVTVDEILTLVNVALGNTNVSTCLAGDANQDGQITIDEILTAVNNALNGC